MDFLGSFLGRSGYLPHGYCFTWTPGLLWSTVTADAVIAASYFSIPITIGVFVKRRKDPSLTLFAGLFCAFIAACGLTHVLDVWTVWIPDYGAAALAKMLTALLSLVTAVALWKLIPEGLKIPSMSTLRSVIDRLESEARHRMTVEGHLAEVRQSLAVTLASIGAGFIAVDRQGLITRMNAVAESVTGWHQGQALGHPLSRVLEMASGEWPFEGDDNPIDVMLARHIDIDVAHELLLRHRHGAITQVELKAALTFGPDGQPVGAVMVFRDVTRLRQAENESNRLAAIVQSSNDAIIGKTLDGVITSWNKAATEMFGYTPEQAIGQPIQMLLPEERLHEEMDILAHVRRGEPVAPFETIRRTRDGEMIEVSLSVSPIRAADGAITGASKIVRGLSRERQAEAALRDAREQARIVKESLEAENRQILEASRIKSQFLANMSHELRTPLNAIIGFAELLQSGAVPVDSPRHQVSLGHIATSGRHLLKLINDVLDLAKVESGRFEFVPEPVDLASLVSEVTDVLQAGAAEKNIALSTRVDEALTGIRVDPARLKQVLFNYLSNAIKFTPEGGRVHVEASPEAGDRFRIAVTDTGVGIEQADLPRLFREFEQLDASHGRRHQGTGLGLALTRRLVEAQGGSVGVKSRVGEGSTFHVVLARVNSAHSIDSKGAAADMSHPQRLQHPEFGQG